VLLTGQSAEIFGSMPVAQIAKETGLSRQTIYRINEDPAASEVALTTWGL
jgi:putative DNA-invertase from lambdoid prophage Rac